MSIDTPELLGFSFSGDLGQSVEIRGQHRFCQLGSAVAVVLSLSLHVEV